MKIDLIQGDITQLNVDVIVNAANSSLRGGGGVDGAIHRAGGRAILDECLLIGGCDVGEAVITTAGNMPSKHVIHTVGPVWRGGNLGEADKLANCYINSLKLAKENNLRTIAFPNISTGVYGYPKQPAADIAIRSIQEVIDDQIEKVIFICFDRENYNIYQDLIKKY
ncbi:MAG: O-acetyl-ADP-ribose deacetylase [Bacteroidota bacterium]